MTVAALYVDPFGPYPRMPNVDAWDESRDARRYAGPFSIVAHPPCGRWGALSHLSQSYDAQLGPLAVEQVRRFGGVLEQPSRSKLWAHCALPEPWCSDRFGFCVEVEQGAWGHVARKRTRLYFVGVNWAAVANTIRMRVTPGYWCSGTHSKARGQTPPGVKVCSAVQRRRTPPAFAMWLVRLAEGAR